MGMKHLILSIVALLFLISPVCAQQKPDSIPLGNWLDRIVAKQEAERLKSYYVNREVANTCESWRSCAKWAFEEYVQDQSFKIVKAEIKTMRRVHRHRVTKETHLFIEATYAHRIVRLEFTTPHIGERKRPYNYIAKFPR